MSVEDRIKQSAAGFCKRLQADLAAQLEEFVVALARAAEEERAAAVAEATERIAAEMSSIRAEAERSAHLQVARVREEAEASLALERARATLESEQAADSRLVAALSDERQSQMQTIERVAGAIRRLDQGQSLTDILTALVDGAAAEVPRVALLTIQGDRLRSWRLQGFGPNAEPVDLEVSKSGVVARALEQGDVAFAEPAAPGHPTPPGPGFTALPPDRSGVAIPILVGGSTVAVLYADDVSETEQIKPAPWPEAIEILARHAALRLENLTAVRTAQALTVQRDAISEAPPAPDFGDDETGSARRYARLLVSEIKLYNEAAVRVGRQKGDLLERLRAEIDRARKLYDERVPATVEAKQALFEDELTQTLADGDASRLGPRTDALA